MNMVMKIISKNLERSYNLACNKENKCKDNQPSILH